MHDPERHALGRAAILLLAVSALRWGVSVRSAEPGVPPTRPDALSDHIDATTAAADEEERRGRPLGEGERVDPNSASEVDLDRLPGVGPSTAAAIVVARDSGLVFGRPDDLLAVRGIGPSTLERIRPWIELRPGRGRARARPPMEPPIDVNRADAEELQRLPGIGPALAARIVEERGRGAFSSVADLVRVRGIGTATVARLQGLVVAGARR